jgi:hypothetical protein
MRALFFCLELSALSSNNSLMKLATLILLAASLFLGASARNPLTGNSFQHLDTAQVADIRAPGLHAIPRSTQSLESLAQASAREFVTINRLRLLNRSFPDGKITRLDRLKSVTLYE